MKSKSVVGLWVSALALVGSSVLSGCHGDASCGDVCKHVLGCEGQDTSDVSKCVSVCEQSPVATPDWRNKVAMASCSTIVPGTGSGGNNPTGGAGGDFSTGTWDATSGTVDPTTTSGSSSSGCYPDGHTCSAGGDCCNGNCIDMSVNQWICY